MSFFFYTVQNVISFKLFFLNYHQMAMFIKFQKKKRHYLWIPLLFKSNAMYLRYSSKKIIFNDKLQCIQNRRIETKSLVKILRDQRRILKGEFPPRK